MENSNFINRLRSLAQELGDLTVEAEKENSNLDVVRELENSAASLGMAISLLGENE